MHGLGVDLEFQKEGVQRICNHHCGNFSWFNSSRQESNFEGEWWNVFTKKNLVFFFFVNGKILMVFINLSSRSIYFVIESKLAVASILELWNDSEISYENGRNSQRLILTYYNNSIYCMIKYDHSAFRMIINFFVCFILQFCHRNNLCKNWPLSAMCPKFSKNIPKTRN